MISIKAGGLNNWRDRTNPQEGELEPRKGDAQTEKDELESQKD